MASSREICHLAADQYNQVCEEAGVPHGRTGPQIIGSAQTAAGTGAAGQAGAQGAAQAPPSSCLRMPLLLLAVVAAGGSCVAVGVHFHGDNGSAAALHQEVKRLRAANEALAERARLAQREQQDLARLILDTRSRQRLTNMMERSKAFEEVTKWNGFPHTPRSTIAVRQCLGRLLRQLNITSVLDVPCGDAGWQHQIPGIHNVTYVGADISIQSLEKAKHRPMNREAGMEFMLFDAVHFPLKRSFDLVLFRNAVEQQRVQDSLTAILNFKTSGSRYLAASYWPNTGPEANEAAHNLAHAGWYEANLLAAPFNFPEPMFSCSNVNEETRDNGRSLLGIWQLRDLPVTSAKVQAAQPEKHAQIRLQGARSADGPPRGVHLLPLRPRRDRGAPAGGPMELPHKELTLDDLLGAFGSAFAPERKHLRPAEVEDEKRHPFDDLFSDWLETAGPVRRGLPSRRAALPTQIFRLPGFAPRGVLH